MSSAPQSSRRSERSSSSASSVQPEQPPQSLIVSNVPVTEKVSDIHGELIHSYESIEKVSRLYDNNGRAINAIAMEFGSNEVMLTILKEKAIVIGNKRYPVRGYWLPVCHQCHQEGHKVFECPIKPVVQRRLVELMSEQKTNYAALVNDFQRKWNTRLSILQTRPSNAPTDQLLPIVKDLTAICQQFNRQNAQIQNQFASVANRVQAMQLKVNS